MKKLLLCSLLAAAVFSTGGANAALNPKVNIVYPIQFHSYDENLVELSFSTTCPGGNHIVSWYVDGVYISSMSFYDQTSMQFTYRVSNGAHDFTVKSCGTGETVQFNVM